MPRVVVILFVFFNLISTVAQSKFSNLQNNIDTIYTNDSDIVVPKTEATYCTIIQAPKDELYPFLEYTFPKNQLVAMGSFKYLNPNIVDGKYTIYHKLTNKIINIRNYNSGKLNGENIVYDSLGRLYEKSNYLNGEIEGEVITYDTIGNIKYKYNFLKGVLNGICNSYYTNGNLKRIEIYKNGKLNEKKSKCYTFKGDDTVFFARQIKPKFPNGTFQNYVNENFDDTYIKNESGKVVVQFTLFKDGSVDTLSAKIIEGEEFVFIGKEAVRLVKLQPRYYPAYFEGVAVQVKCKVTVVYYSEN